MPTAGLCTRRPAKGWLWVYPGTTRLLITCVFKMADSAASSKGASPLIHAKDWWKRLRVHVFHSISIQTVLLLCLFCVNHCQNIYPRDYDLHCIYRHFTFRIQFEDASKVSADISLLKRVDIIHHICSSLSSCIKKVYNRRGATMTIFVFISTTKNLVAMQHFHLWLTVRFKLSDIQKNFGFHDTMVPVGHCSSMYRVCSFPCSIWVVHSHSFIGLYHFHSQCLSPLILLCRTSTVMWLL